MELNDAVSSRRSIRKFTDMPVSDEHITELLYAGTLAPSSKNRQQWGFTVLRADEKDRLAEITEKNADISAAGSSVKESCRVMREASAVILVCQRVSSGFMRSDMLSIGACIENICLKAVDMGFGALWICDIDEAEEQISAELGIKQPIIAAVAIGYPGEEPKQRPRLSVSEITEWR